jgi:hypothetical protein
MDFREYAAKETSELVDKLARAAAAGAQAAVQRTADEAKVKLEASQAEVKARSERVAALEAAHAAAERRIEELQAAHDQVQAAHDKQKAEAAAHERQLRQELDSVQRHLRAEAEAAEQQFRQQLEALQQKLRADAQSAQAAQERIRLDAHAAQEKVRQDLQAKIDAAVAAQARAAELAKNTEAQLRAARAHAEAARADLEAAKADVVSADGQMERLLICFESLASAGTITDLLLAFADCLAGEFERVALFRVKGNKLQGEYQTGFDSGTDVAKVVIPLSMDSLLARAVASGCIETMESDNPETVRMPLGGTPSCALALPVAAGGETLGILYADDGPDGAQVVDTSGARSLKGRFAELVLRHAVALALRLTAELRTIAELRGHAARLLNHAEEMYAADLDAGVPAADLRARLLENVECARRLYAQRVAIEGPAAAGLLEDQLVLLIDQRGGSPFGRDLAAILENDERAAC